MLSGHGGCGVFGVFGGNTREDMEDSESGPVSALGLGDVTVHCVRALSERLMGRDRRGETGRMR